MLCLQNSRVVYLSLLLPFLVSACLTPEERAEVYGVKKPAETPVVTQNVVPDNNINGGFAPPKAAPTTRVTTSNLAPLQGLRRSATGIDVQRVANNTDCGIAAFSYLQGQALSSLSSIQFTQPIRVVLPGQDVTKGYNANRLNFNISEQGVIVQMWCG